jgi:hypothetical protein
MFLDRKKEAKEHEKNIPNVICSEFLRGSSFVLLVLFQNFEIIYTSEGFSSCHS